MMVVDYGNDKEKIELNDIINMWESFINDITLNISKIIDKIKKEGADFVNPIIKNALEWISNFQDETGGFKNEVGEEPLPTITSYVIIAFLASGLKQTERISKAIKYLIKAQKNDGSWPYYEATDGAVGPTVIALKALRMANMDRDESFIKGRNFLINYIQETINEDPKPLNVIKVALAITEVYDYFRYHELRDAIINWILKSRTARGSYGITLKGDTESTITVYEALHKLGVDPTEKHMEDMINYVFSQIGENKLFRRCEDGEEKLDTTAYILCSLEEIGYNILEDETLLSVVSSILASANDDGGFPEMIGKPSDIETTALVVTALSKSGVMKVVSLERLNVLLQKFKNTISNNGGLNLKEMEKEFNILSMKIDKLNRDLKMWKSVSGMLASITFALISLLLEKIL